MSHENNKDRHEKVLSDMCNQRIVTMSRLHPVFNVIKLTPAPVDPIQGQHLILPPPPKIIEGEEEWVVVKLQDYPILSGQKRCRVEFWIGKYKVHVQYLKQIRARPQCMCCATCHLCALDFGQRE